MDARIALYVGAGLVVVALLILWLTAKRVQQSRAREKHLRNLIRFTLVAYPRDLVDCALSLPPEKTDVAAAVLRFMCYSIKPKAREVEIVTQWARLSLVEEGVLLPRRTDIPDMSDPKVRADMLQHSPKAEDIIKAMEYVEEKRGRSFHRPSAEELARMDQDLQKRAHMTPEEARGEQ